jgi:hypothetical protein
MGNLIPNIEEQTTRVTQWPKEKGRKENSYLQNIAQKTKDRATPTPQKKQRLMQVLRKDKLFLFHMWHPSKECCCYKEATESRVHHLEGFTVATWLG